MTVASASTSRCQKREAEKRGPTTTRRAVDQRLHARVQRVRVEERQARVEDVVGGQAAEHGRGAVRPPVELGLRAADTLRGAGRARGVEDRGRVAGTHRLGGDGLPGAGKAADRQTAVGRVAVDAEEPDALQLGRQELDGVELGEELRVDGEHAWARVDDHVRELRTAGCRVERDEDRPEPRGREPGVDDLGPVLRHDRDAVACDDPRRAERARQPPDRVTHLGEAPAELPDLEEGPVAEGLGLALEQRWQRPLSRWHVFHLGANLPAGQARRPARPCQASSASAARRRTISAAGSTS